MEEPKAVRTPVSAGDIVLDAESSKLELPNGEVYELHISEVEKIRFSGDSEDKLSVTMTIDKGEFKGQSFKKTFNIVGGARSGLVRLAMVIYNEKLPSLQIDPTELVDEPFRVIFSTDSFDGKTYQKATYMIPSKGQTITVKEQGLSEADLKEAGLL